MKFLISAIIKEYVGLFSDVRKDDELILNQQKRYIKENKISALFANSNISIFPSCKKRFKMLW